MGYQESLVTITPQKQFNLLLEAYKAAKTDGFYETLVSTQPMSVVVLKEPIGNFSVGSKFIWVCGDRCFHSENGILNKHISRPLFSKLHIIPVENIYFINDERLDGINFNSEIPSENKYLKRYNIDEYIKEKIKNIKREQSEHIR